MNDLISREEAIEVIKEKIEPHRQWLDELYIRGCEESIESIKALPTAQKKGRWIFNDRDGSWACWTCSECGRLVHLTDYKENVQEEYPFCHCGAYMGEKNDA